MGHLRNVPESHGRNIPQLTLSVFEPADHEHVVSWPYAKGINFVSLQNHLRANLVVGVQTGIQLRHGSYSYVVLGWMEQPMPIREIKNSKLATLCIQSNDSASVFNDMGISDGEQYPLTGSHRAGQRDKESSASQSRTIFGVRNGRVQIDDPL
jgi:hypothetical protein